jgi:hypothetical protein
LLAFLRIVGNRKPPFLLTLTGDLTFRTYADQTNKCVFTVITVENDGNPAQATAASPISIRSTLPFVKISSGEVRRKPYYLPHTMQVEREYVVYVEPGTTNASFYGEITVTDPWDSQFAQSINMQGNVYNTIVVFPSHVTLAMASADDYSASVEFAVRFRDSSTERRLDVDQGENQILDVTRVATAASQNFFRYRVSLKPGTVVRKANHKLNVRNKGSIVGSVSVGFGIKHPS